MAPSRPTSSVRATPETIRTRAIVLRLVDYRESDRIATLFTEALGRVGAIARGARKSQRRFGGARTGDDRRYRC